MLETILVHTARTLPVYAFAALGGLLSERSGVIHLGLEAVVLASALAASATAIATQSLLLAALAGLLAGALVGVAHGVCTNYARIDAVVSGLALNLMVAAGSRAILRAAYASSSNSPSFTASGRLEWLWLGLVVALTAAVAVMLRRSRFGVALRAVGADPAAARSAGLSVAGLRCLAVVLGSTLAGAAGIALAFDQHQFQAGMSGGRGYVALVVVIVARRQPWPVLGAALGFAALEALDVALQGRSGIPSELLAAMPYLATLLALALAGARRPRLA